MIKSIYPKIILSTFLFSVFILIGALLPAEAIDFLPLPQKSELNFKNPFLSALPKKEVKVEKPMKRPVVTRPKKRAIPKQKKVRPKAKITKQKRVTHPKQKITPPSLTIRGIVWGTQRPQAIVNGEVVSVGDTILGATVTAIDKTGIQIDYKGKSFTILYN